MVGNVAAPVACKQSTSSWEPIINLGLPRSGTSSFAAASLALGMRTTHGCSKSHPIKELGACFFNGTVEGRCFLEGASAAVRPLRHAVDRASIDSHSDTPWFLVNVNQLRAAHPRAGLLCTTRSADSWVSSMMTFTNRSLAKGSPTEVPGGTSFLWHMRKVVLAHWPPHHPTAALLRQSPFNLRHDALHAFYEVHHSSTCAGLPEIKLNDDASAKWAAFCSAIQVERFQQRCQEALAKRRAWPRVNVLHGSSAVPTYSTSQKAYHREVWEAAEALKLAPRR